MIWNHIKEARLTVVHHVVDGLAPTACKHLTNKAECYGKEFPFIYQHYEVTDIPDRHAKGGNAVVSHLVFAVRFKSIDLTPMPSIPRARSYKGPHSHTKRKARQPLGLKINTEQKGGSGPNSRG